MPGASEACEEDYTLKRMSAEQTTLATPQMRPYHTFLSKKLRGRHYLPASPQIAHSGESML